MSNDILQKLWHDYRDEERCKFTEKEWLHYKVLFKRFVNFPDWLHEKGVTVSVEGLKVEPVQARIDRLVEGSMRRGIDEARDRAHELILEAIKDLGEDAYGTTIVKWLGANVGAPIHYPMVQTRLKELIAWSRVETYRRPDNPHLYYRVTDQTTQRSNQP